MKTTPGMSSPQRNIFAWMSGTPKAAGPGGVRSSGERGRAGKSGGPPKGFGGPVGPAGPGRLARRPPDRLAGGPPGERPAACPASPLANG